MSETVVDDLVEEHSAFDVDAHAAQWIFGIEVDGEVLADGVDLVATEGQQLVPPQRMGLVSDVLQAHVDLHRH